jgi:hypothetical protein
MTVLNQSILHPFIAWIIVLCLCAQATPYAHPAFIVAFAYATFLTLLDIAFMISDRIAFGVPRQVDLSEEVIVITGGASGLGRLVAQIYGLRGGSVAVLDIAEEKDVKGWEDVGGVEYYRCDIGVRDEVETVARRIEEDVCLVSLTPLLPSLCFLRWLSTIEGPCFVMISFANYLLVVGCTNSAR